MNPPLFTVLLPIVRPPVYLASSVATVLAQTVREFELVIVCDGAPPSTVAASEAWAKRDRRVRVLVRPKGERHGEQHRDEALATATSQYVCQIDDDALWFPDHLATMAALLRQADFAHTTHARVCEDGSFTFIVGNLNDAAQRQRMATEPHNWIGVTNAGYRLDAYRRLPVGWSPAPPDVWSDLWMWRKFIAQPFAFASSLRVTSLFLHREKGDASPSAIAQHRAFAERIVLGNGVAQGQIEQGLHARVCAVLGSGRLL